MKVIVGLGNPGEEYAPTRHNVGFVVLERLFERMTNDKTQISNEIQMSNFKFNHKMSAEIARAGELMLVKPQTFMNKSGEVIKKIVDFFKLQGTGNKEHVYNELFVIHDDLDIKLGEYKIQFGKGPKVHNGLNSMEKALGTSEFWRVRLGIENREASNKLQVTGEAYVLGKFTQAEKEILDNTLRKVTDELVSRYL